MHKLKFVFLSGFNYWVSAGVWSQFLRMFVINLIKKIFLKEVLTRPQASEQHNNLHLITVAVLFLFFYIGNNLYIVIQ